MAYIYPVRLSSLLKGNIKRASRILVSPSHFFSTSSSVQERKSYRLLVVGGGTGGSAIVNKFAQKLGKGLVACVEPEKSHYYQAHFTLVGAGLKNLDDAHGQTGDVLNAGCDWIRDKVMAFDPDNNTVTTANGDEIKYEFLVVALGLKLDYDKVVGLPEALADDPRVCSIYSHQYVNKTWAALQKLEMGTAIFTYPNSPIKCPGAPQKICYLAENYLRKNGNRDKFNIIYKTSLPEIVPVPRYAEPLNKVIKSRGIQLNCQQNLIEVNHAKSEAVFELLDKHGETETVKYDFLHVSPPMSAPEVLQMSPLVDAEGFVDVNQGTLQSVKYPNVFSLGDCSNLPTLKTATAIAAQSRILEKNLNLVMKGRKVGDIKYDGYAACPLIISDKECIMAEVGYEYKIMETFPFNQAKGRRSMYLLNKCFSPMYWHMLVKGKWHGPAVFRKIFHLGKSA